MISAPASAHEWEDGETWAIQLAQDLNEVTRCYSYILDSKIQPYKQSCWPKMIAVDHNRMLADIANERKMHPDMEIEQFLYDHYQTDVAESLVVYWNNAAAVPQAMVYIFAADAIMRVPE